MKPLNAQVTAAMAKVPQSRTSAEDRVAAALRGLGFAYRRNVPSLPGKPDFANQSKGWAIQVHGCFWHRHDCGRGTLPVHNQEAWIEKFRRNKVRDERVESDLREHGLRVITIWECETKKPEMLRRMLSLYLR